MFHLYPPENIKKPNVPFLYPLKTSKSQDFLRFSGGIEK